MDACNADRSISVVSSPRRKQRALDQEMKTHIPPRAWFSDVPTSNLLTVARIFLLCLESVLRIKIECQMVSTDTHVLDGH